MTPTQCANCPLPTCEGNCVASYVANILAAQLRPMTEAMGQLTTTVSSNTAQIAKNSAAISEQGDIVNTNADSIQALQDSFSSSKKTGADLMAKAEKALGDFTTRVSSYEENQSRRDRLDLTR